MIATSPAGPASRLDILLDNPILTKHVRSRLRRDQALPWAVVVVVLCLCIIWAGQAFNLLNSGAAMAFLLGLQAIVLAFVGAQQVASAVGGARESGILDFHRVSPLTPLWVTLGFFFGAPIREYLLYAVTLPFAVTLAVLSPLGFLGLIALEVPLVLVSWLIHAIALLGSLVAKKPRGASRGGVAGVIMLAIFLAQPLGSVIWYGTSRLRGESLTIPFFGLPVPWLLFLLVYLLVPIGFLLLACTRRMRAEKAHVYRKSEAVAALGTLGVLLMGAFTGLPGWEAVVLTTIYLMVFAAMILVATVTPDHAEYVRGLRRAERHGLRRPGAWSDEGSNRLVLMLCCALVFLTSTVVWEAVVGRDSGRRGSYSLTIAIAVFVVAYVGLAHQYFLLRLPKSGGAYLGLFLFLVWLLPILIGSISAGSGARLDLTLVILGISPVTGIALSSGLGGLADEVPEAARLAALVPAVSFAFLFNFLLVAYQRRLDRAVLASLTHRKESGPFDYLDKAGEPVGALKT